MTYTIVNAVCCRTWPVLLGVQMRHCGICGSIPKINSIEPVGTIDVDCNFS